MNARMVTRCVDNWALVAVLAVLTCCASAAAADAPTWNRDIRPILADHCFPCHGADAGQRKAGLRLDVPDAGEDAGVIVAGDGAGSPLVARISAHDPAEVMPPPESKRELAEDDRRAIVAWIDAGAIYEPHWSFVPPVPAAVPAVEHPVDVIVRRRLAREGLTLSPEADRITLLRRVTLDLVGLPPTRAEVAAFLADDAPGAYERVVDRLLGSPHYGERMALPWLDAARYADSNGFQQDGDTFQWLWRDWLVRELNRDTPYDELSTQMLAGDLLPGATDETRLATAFNRNHLLNGEGGAIPEENRFVAMFDRVDATATTWLGLTMACAQCHDHKYDPITQRDYYGLLDAFNRVPEKGTVDGSPSRIRVAPPLLDYPDDDLRARRARLEAAVAAAGDDEEAKQATRSALDVFLRDEWPRVMVMSDGQPRETHVLDRGAYLSPREAVTFATPAFLPPMDAGLPRNRLGLARWLFDPANPLVARVAVNRAWQTLFGVGLVRTPEDFGTQSAVPEQQELLDHLAVWYREHGWRTKALHRLIVTSAVYRQSSATKPELRERDPENRLLARARRVRLPAMLLRDVALATSGLLVPDLGGAPVYPYQPDDVWEPLAITKERDFTYPASHGQALRRRSLYTFWRRTIAPANMFDVSSRQTCRVRIPVTASPLHALTMLNDPTWVEAARALGERCLHEDPDPAVAVAIAFQIVTARSPENDERSILVSAYAGHRHRFLVDPEAARDLLAVGEAPRDASIDAVTHAAVASTCLMILNLDEAITRE